MQFSFRIPNADYLGFPATPDAIVTAAQRAERLGYDALLLNDNLIINGAADVVASWGNVYEPLTTMAFLADQTGNFGADPAPPQPDTDRQDRGYVGSILQRPHYPGDRRRLGRK